MGQLVYSHQVGVGCTKSTSIGKPSPVDYHSRFTFIMLFVVEITLEIPFEMSLHNLLCMDI
ncbi:MAG: hypothetical protein VX313_05520, partial [Bacteroidota bacterium]|nr:hypothetical protein [Bacteroidota bacterium]